MTPRLLQVIPDTTDSPANLAALRHHGLLARNGIEIRTLAIAPGSGHQVPTTVPTMAPSARSLAAFTQLRRELRWPDAVLAVDVLPRAVLGRSKVPVIAVSGTGASRERLVSTARQNEIVRVVVLPTGGSESSSAPIGTCCIRTPYDPGPGGAVVRTEASRRAARTALGVQGDETIAVGMDPVDGGVVSIWTVRDGHPEKLEHPGLRNGSRASRDVEERVALFEILMHAADVVTPSRSLPGRPPDALLPALVDLMVAGVVPAGWPRSLDKDLLGGDTVVVIDGNDGRAPTGSGNAPDVDAGVVTRLDQDRRRLRRMSSNVATLASELCDPRVIHRQWTEILAQALPSQT